MQANNFAATVLAHENLGQNIYLLTVQNAADAPAPVAGQFYMLRNWGQSEAPLLSRPISLHSYDAQSGAIQFLYEKRGIGTEKLAAAAVGSTVTLTGPAGGKGFPVAKLAGNIALVGGGIGTAPLYQLAKDLAEKGCTVHFFAGYRDVPYRLDAFEAVCSSVAVATDSGNFGTKGFVTDLVDYTAYDAICTCGPEIMMEKVAKAAMAKNVPVYVSLEGKMACGIGACLGCTCHKKSGAVCVCKAGPVFDGRLIYEQH